MLADVPPIVLELAAKLAAPLPADRYQRVHGLQFDLEQCLERWNAHGAIAPFVLGAWLFFVEVLLTGTRGISLSRLAAL